MFNMSFLNPLQNQIEFDSLSRKSAQVLFHSDSLKGNSLSSDVGQRGFLFNCQLDLTRQPKVVYQVYFMQRFFF